MQATGMSIEELFAYLSDALTAHKQDRFPPSVLTDGRMSEVENLLIYKALYDLTDTLVSNTERIVDHADAVKLIEVNERDNLACVEITPVSLGEARNPTNHIVYPRRRRVAKGRPS